MEKMLEITLGNALTPEWLTSSPPPVENWEGEAPLVEEPYGYGKQFSEQR